MLIAVLFAGQHTSSVTCTWTLLSMLANQVKHQLMQASVHVTCAQARHHATCHATLSGDAMSVW